MTLIASVASYFLKISTKNISLLSIFTNLFFYLGGILYFAAACINIWLLQKLPYSIVVPLGGIAYIWTMIIACIFLKEKINKNKITGVFLILFGVACIAI